MGKYLVTGGCGFIGSHLVEGLLKKNHEVRVIDDLSSGKKENISKDVEFIEASITDRKSLSQALEGVDGCFHLAAIASVEKSTQKWSQTHEVNLTGLLYLFEEIKKFSTPIPVIYASSAAVYGHSSLFPLKESEKNFPVSPYGADKLACEQQAHVAYELFKIPSIGFRFFNVYGPRQSPHSPYSGVIAIFLDKILKGESIKIFGDGFQQRDFIYIDDIIEGLLKVTGPSLKGANVYNLCTGDSNSINNLADLIQELTQKRAVKQSVPPRLGDPKLSLGDPMLFERDYGFKPKISLKEGLAKLIRGCGI